MLSDNVSFMPYVPVGGIDLYYEAHGTGPHVVILAHGALGSIDFAEASGLRAATLAARGLRVIAYDARGHGRSGYFTGERDYGQQMLAGELLGLLDALELTRVTVCGTSMGATSALLLAQVHPERVDRLVLRSPPPFGDDMIPARRALYGLAVMYRVLGVTLTARLAALRPFDGEPARTYALVRGQRRAAVVPALRGFLAEPLDTARLPAIGARTLVLTQPGDALHPLRSGEVLNSAMPAAALCVAPSRLFWRDRSEDMADLIAAFVHGRDDEVRHYARKWSCAYTTTRQEGCTAGSDASSRLD
jgi:pimeloyl-ACP methyl ester carboxylesterase